MSLQITKAYDRIKALDWEPSYISKGQKVVETTRFHLTGLKPLDPFKTFLREYFTMEQEKENRHYSILEASSRLHSGPRDARWMEAMKFVLGNLVGLEYAAGRQMGRMARSLAPMELRQGYMMQMLDEMRHAQLEMNNVRQNMRSWEDPAGYDIILSGAASNVGGGLFRSFMEDLTTCDPVETSIGLQIFVETGYSNVFFVGMSSAAAAHGDDPLASTMLTIQSDESRHMANGWATLALLLQDDRNIPLIQQALDKWFWRAHVGFGMGLALVQDYFMKNRTESAKESALRWVYDEFLGGFYQKLERYGIKAPPHLDDQIAELDSYSHSAAIYIFGAWPFFYHRADPMTSEDMDWLEKKYPGWHSKFGWFWDAYGRCTDPRDRAVVLKELGGLPSFCEVCQRPLIFPTPDKHTGRSRVIAGKNHIFCSTPCETIYINDPTRYQTDKGFYDLYEGCELSEVAERSGYVRDDGQTLMGQPVLQQEKMWTLDDLRACNYIVTRPPPPPALNPELVAAS